MKRRPSKRVLLIAAAVAALLAALFAVLPVREWLDGFEDRIEMMDLAMGLLVFAGVYVVATLLLVPAWIFPIAAGALFGLGWGSAVTLAATAVSSGIAFVTTRYLLRGPAERLVRKHRLFKCFDEAVGKDGWRIVALLRMSPVLSSGMKSYFFGLTCVKPDAYMTGTMLGMLPGLLLKVWVGSAGRDAMTRGGPLQWTLLATGLAATIAASVIVTRLTKRRLKFAG
jgi:uncharacterized membrane protein YdjX (TVP38/TMEM64 family)